MLCASSNGCAIVAAVTKVPSNERTTVVGAGSACAGDAVSTGTATASAVATATPIDSRRLINNLRPRRWVQVTTQSHRPQRIETFLTRCVVENDPCDPGRVEPRRGRRGDVERFGRRAREPVATR